MSTRHIFPKFLHMLAGRIGITSFLTHFAVIVPAACEAPAPQESQTHRRNNPATASLTSGTRGPHGSHMAGQETPPDKPGWLILDNHRGELRAAISSGLFTRASRTGK